ncbi:deoxyribose-phosphate aldolase [Zopfochytrium polystomum]|nr:deoxyribose-phosphate aldolase [Zopfochytrium polystomum]
MASRPTTLTLAQLAKTLDHSPTLKPDATPAQVDEATRVARHWNVASVCVRPCDVARAAAALRGSSVACGTVVGFPHGAATSAVKAFEAKDAIDNGATELDMVLNIGRLLAGDLAYVQSDIEAVVKVAREASPPAIVKVILETAFLNPEQIAAACAAAERAGADFVKTSTGFAHAGANVPDLLRMRAAVGDRGVRIKASGGIRTLRAALDAIDAGCSRVGTSATVAILEEFARVSGGGGGEGGVGEGSSAVDKAEEGASGGY